MKNGMTMPKLLLLVAEALAAVMLVVVSVNHFGWGDGGRITVSFLIAYLVPRIILSRSRGYSVAAGVVLLMVAVLCVSLDVARMALWIKYEEFSLSFPNIGGDGRNYFKWALAIYNSNMPPDMKYYPGFSLIIASLWKLLGVSVVWPLAMNLMFTLTSVVMTGLTTRRLLTGRVTMSSTSLVTTGMVLCGLLFHYLVIGTCMLKEGTVIGAMAMAGFAMAAMAAPDEERHALWRDIILLVVAGAILAVVRASYIYFLMLGLVIMALPHWRRDWPMVLSIMAVMAVMLLAGRHFAFYSIERHGDVVAGGWNMNRFYINSASQLPYKSLLGYYFLYSPLHRLFVLPIPLAVQFLLPLPWTQLSGVTIFTFFSRLTWGWYLVGGLAAFYYLFIGWRRHLNMGAWPWWPALVFGGIAYVMAGSVVRYVLPIQALFIPVAAYVIARWREGQWRVQLRYWAILFIILLLVTLVISFQFKQGYFDPWLPEPPITE